jgi:outer membrane protein TolC
MDTLHNTEFNLENNIDYNLLKTQEKLSEMDLKNEKMKYLPTVSAFYNFRWDAQRNSFNFFSFDEKWYQTQLLGINVNIPIFKSGAQKTRVQKAAIAVKQARNTKQQAVEGLFLEASSARSDLESANENYIHTQANMKLSNKVYDVTLIKYKEGVASSMDLTQAHNTFLVAQSEFIQAMSILLTAKNKLDRLNSNY